MPDCIDEFCESRNQFRDCVNQKSDGDNLHGFSPHFVRLDWRDMSEVESRGRTERECLLWTQGSVMGINQQNSGQPVFKEAALKPLPRPILLTRPFHTDSRNDFEWTFAWVLGG